MLFLLVLILILTICYYWAFGHDRTTRKFLKDIAAPPSKLLLGHTWELRSTTKALKMNQEYLNIYGRTLKINLGPLYTLIFTSEYKFVEFVLTSSKTLKKSFNYEWMKPWLGTGLLTADGGPKWAKNRKILTPAFHFEILKQFVENFESEGDILVKKLKKFEDSKNFDVYPIITLCTLDIICETAMGVKMNAQTEINLPYVNSVGDFCEIFITRFFSPLKLFNPIFALTKDYYRQNKAIKVLHGFTSSVIAKKVETLKNKQIDNLRDDPGIKKKLALLDLLLDYSQKGNLMSYDEIRQEVDTFMFAGHDTTATAISFTLFALANNPEVQEKVYEEEKFLFGNTKNPTITHDELQQMNYLDLVIKESLRLYPPVPILGRLSTEEVAFGDSLVPKDCNIGLSVFSIQRDAKYWKEPEKFNPERFHDYDGTQPFSYIPFSAGSRNCIGQKFAMLEMKSVLSKILRNFQLLPTDPPCSLELAIETVLKSANGVKIRLVERT